MENILKTIPINISSKPIIIDNVLIVGDYSPKEIQIYTSLFKECHDAFSLSYGEMLGIIPIF